MNHISKKVINEKHFAKLVNCRVRSSHQVCRLTDGVLPPSGSLQGKPMTPGQSLWVDSPSRRLIALAYQAGRPPGE